MLTVVATYAGGATQDVTAVAAWSSSNSLVATVSDATGQKGLLAGIGVGNAEVSATLNSIVGRAVFQITAPALMGIEVSPANPTIPKGAVAQLFAVGSYSDHSTQDLSSVVSWKSVNETVASVSNATGSRGMVTGLEKGSTGLAARFSDVEGITVVFVADPILTSIALTPTQPSIALNTTQQFVATGTYSDKSAQDISSLVTWTSSATGIASISNASGSKGLATALSTGVTTISASSGSLSGTTVLIATNATVTSLSVNPTNPTRAKGTTEQFIATASFSDGSTQDVTSLVSWVSSATSVATVSNVSGSRGLATLSNGGMTSIKASLSGTTASTNLTVTNATLASLAVSPTNPSIASSTSLPLTAIATFSDATTQDLTGSATWQSSGSAVASVSDAAGSKGQVTGASSGVASISATVSGVSGSTSVTVTTATLTSMAVTPTNPTLGKGTTLNFTATGTYSDNSTQDLTGMATWASANTGLVTISNAVGSKGLATALATGTTTVSANASGMVGSTPVTVSGATLASIAVTPSSLSLTKGSTEALLATGTYSDNSIQDLTQQVAWSSNDTTVATVSNATGSRGLVTTLAVGASTLTATLNSRSGAATLTVTAATLSTIDVSPSNPAVAKGSTRQFSATGRYSDSSTQDLTTQVNWTSNATSVVSISNASGFKGLASALTAGSATIAATYGGLSGSTPMTVTNATLTSISITPTNPTIPRNGIQQFIATGNYSDGTSASLTTQVTWASSNAGVATISNAMGSKGRANALAAGTTIISATLLAITGQTSMTVSP